MARSGSRKRTRSAAGLLVAGAGVLAAVGLLEAFLRLFAPQPLGMSHITDEGLTTNIPGARVRHRRRDFDHRIEINSLGIRGPEVSIPKPRGCARVLVLGDSFVEGKQVALEDTLTERLRRSLSARVPGDCWDVVNGGISGYGTADEIKFFHSIGRRLDADVVVLLFTTGNDFENNHATRFFRLVGGTLEERPLPQRSRIRRVIDRIKETAASRSHVYQWLRDRLPQLAARAGDARGAELEEYRRRLFRTTPDSEIAADLRLTAALLDRLVADVRASGATLLVAALPSRFQVNDAEWTEFSAGDRSLQRDRPQRWLEAFARSRGLPFLDLFPALLDANRIAPAYHRFDGHFNARGHAIAADEILRALVERRLLAGSESVEKKRDAS